MPSGRHGLGFAFDVIPTGLEYLAAMIEDAVSQVHIIDLKMEKRCVDYFLHRLNPDLVGISMCATEHTGGLEIAGAAKSRGITTVIGNFHATGLAPYFTAHPAVDYVIRGEGEAPFLDLIQSGHAQEIPGISYKNESGIVHNADRPLIDELDQLPFPARHLRKYDYRFQLDKEKKMEALTFSRGCWGKCTFCCEPSMNRGIQRYRSAENILQEIIAINEYHGGKPILIALTDPCALGNPLIVEELCDLLIPLGFKNIEIGCHVRPDKVIANPDIIGKMVQAGFVAFEMGIESPNKRDLARTQKGFGPDIHQQACQILRSHGAQPLGTFVIGLPEQTEKEILSFPAYGRQIGLSRAAFGIATPFPDTDFYKSLAEKDLIFEKDWNKFDEMHSTFHLENLPDKRIETLFARCMAKFWTIEKLLDIEAVEWKRTGKKKTLVEFGQYVRCLMEVGQHGLIQLQGDQFIQYILEFLDAASDEDWTEITESIQIHEIISMDRFLHILGDQTIQVTFIYQSQPLTSWIFHLKDRMVDRIQATKGVIDESSMHFKFDLDYLEKHPKPSSFQIFILICKLLYSNKGLSRRLNQVKLLLAIILGGGER